MNNIPEYTVSQLNKSIKDLLEENYSYLKLVGETGSITIASSGHVYFSIKEKRTIAGPFFLTVSAIVYLGEIYGAWRSAKYYQNVIK